jgi:transcription initiation factor TFIIB
MAELDRLTDKLHIPPTIKEKAAVIYRKALEKGLVRGRSISAIAAASLYAACRLTQTPRTLRELSRHSPIDKKDIARCYRLLLRELNLQMPIPAAQLRVPKIAHKVGVGEKTQQKAVDILREAERLKTTAGKDPMGLAAAALYIACVMNDEKRTQKMIADAAGVTEVTIRNRYKGLKEALNLEI